MQLLRKMSAEFALEASWKPEISDDNTRIFMRAIRCTGSGSGSGVSSVKLLGSNRTGTSVYKPT
jgi:hypothetical protein